MWTTFSPSVVDELFTIRHSFCYFVKDVIGHLCHGVLYFLSKYIIEILTEKTEYK